MSHGFRVTVTAASRLLFGAGTVGRRRGLPMSRPVGRARLLLGSGMPAARPRRASWTAQRIVRWRRTSLRQLRGPRTPSSLNGFRNARTASVVNSKRPMQGCVRHNWEPTGSSTASTSPPRRSTSSPSGFDVTSTASASPALHGGGTWSRNSSRFRSSSEHDPAVRRARGGVNIVSGSHAKNRGSPSSVRRSCPTPRESEGTGDGCCLAPSD
jgi:hypothetical protein